MKKLLIGLVVTVFVPLSAFAAPAADAAPCAQAIRNCTSNPRGVGFNTSGVDTPLGLPCEDMEIDNGRTPSLMKPCQDCIAKFSASGTLPQHCGGFAAGPAAAPPPIPNPGNLQACLAAKAMGGDVHGMC